MFWLWIIDKTLETPGFYYNAYFLGLPRLEFTLHSFLRIWPRLLKKSLIENLVFLYIFICNLLLSELHRLILSVSLTKRRLFSKRNSFWCEIVKWFFKLHITFRMVTLIRTKSNNSAQHAQKWILQFLLVRFIVLDHKYSHNPSRGNVTFDWYWTFLVPKSCLHVAGLRLV